MSLFACCRMPCFFSLRFFKVYLCPYLKKPIFRKLSIMSFVRVVEWSSSVREQFSKSCSRRFLKTLFVNKSRRSLTAIISLMFRTREILSSPPVTNALKCLTDNNNYELQFLRPLVGLYETLIVVRLYSIVVVRVL